MYTTVIDADHEWYFELTNNTPYLSLMGELWARVVVKVVVVVVVVVGGGGGGYKGTLTKKSKLFVSNMRELIIWTKHCI